MHSKYNIDKVMRRLLFLLCTAIAAQTCMAQLTLEECYREANDNYPAIKQYKLIEASGNFTLSNAAKGYLPQVKVLAGANAFTDILDLPQQTASLGVDMKNYLLDAGVIVNQSIYDGGAIASKQRVAKAQTEVDKKNMDVTMYGVRNRIEQLFFGVLTLDEQIKQNKLLQTDLGLSHNTVSGMIKGGVANQSDLDAVSVEEVKTRQTEGSLLASRHAYLKMLATFIGKDLSDSVVLTRPGSISAPEGYNAMARPEINYYAAQNQLLDAKRKQLDSQLKPTLSAFGLGMYHSRLTDIIKNGVLAAGVTLSWNIGALYTRKNDIKQIETQRGMYNTQQETFLFNSRLQSESTNGTISNLKEQIGQDDEIIRLRRSIHGKSLKKVQSGTETVNEMLRDINAVSEAQQQKALHEIQLLKELYDLRNINNY